MGNKYIHIVTTLATIVQKDREAVEYARTLFSAAIANLQWPDGKWHFVPSSAELSSGARTVREHFRVDIDGVVHVGLNLSLEASGDESEFHGPQREELKRGLFFDTEAMRNDKGKCMVTLVLPREKSITITEVDGVALSDTLAEKIADLVREAIVPRYLVETLRRQ